MTSEILSETPMSMYQLKAELGKIKKRDNELSFRATKTEEHLDRLNLPKNGDTLYQKLLKLNITRLKDQHICKILDLMPKTVKDLKVVMQGYPISLSNENMKKIIDVINESD